MSCTFFSGVRVGVLGVHLCSKDRVRFRVRVRVRFRVRMCGYMYNRCWGLQIRVQSTEYAEKIETD